MQVRILSRIGLRRRLRGKSLGCAIVGVCALTGCMAPTVTSREQMVPLAGSAPIAPTQPYLLNPEDVIRITVFGEPDLTVASARIQNDGTVDVPLLGPVQARGATTQQFARALEGRYGPSILIKPRVTVELVSSAVRRFTVEGSVTLPGVFELTGPTTLLQALARAQSPTRLADLKRVAIIRYTDRQRTGAVFDVTHIRAGQSDDPQILAGDVVVVTESGLKSAYRDLLTAAPVLAIFRPY